MPMFLSFHAYLFIILCLPFRENTPAFDFLSTLGDTGRHWATLGDTRQHYDFGLPYFCFVTREEEALLPNP